MENDFLILDASKSFIVDRVKKRIEKLFGVKVGFQNCENGEISCVLQKKDASKSSMQAKEYIYALVGEGSDFTVITNNYDHSGVMVILNNQDAVEQESATVLTSNGENEIKIQGKLENIIKAKNIIDMLLKNNVTHSSTRHEVSNRINDLNSQAFSLKSDQRSNEKDIRAKVLDDRTLAFHNENVSLFKGNNFSENSIQRFEHLVASRDVNGSPLSSQGAGSPFGYMGNQSNNHGLNQFDFHTAVAELKVAENVTDSSDSDSDDEKEEEIKKDPDYPNKVEFALKLGYSEFDLLQALLKLGATAGQNELLSELIKQGSSLTKDSDTDGSKEASPIFLSEDTEELQLFTYHRRQAGTDETTNLRPIVMDGSNVAMSHGNKEVFSCRGIQLAVDWFRQRGHKDITVFVPQWRKETSRTDARIKDQDLLFQLEKEKVLVFTPARRIGGKRVVCYDDRYVLKLAVENNGIVVSNDNYRDLLNEKAEFKKVVEEHLLMYSFVNDRFMPPDDPLGRSGPTLDNFLQKEPTQPEPLPPPCPYGSKKCTYGNKCKYYHPERKNIPHKSVTEKLAEQAKQRMQEMRERKTAEEGKKKLSGKKSLQRTKSYNPSDNSSDQLQQGSNLDDWNSVSESAEEEKYRLYNQNLTEKLRKMEQEQQQKENQSSPRKDEHQSVLRRVDRSVENLRSGGASPRGASPRGSSPVSNLSVPGQRQYHDSEHFLSGHLLLAKKLSDEADESDKLRKMESLKENDPLQTSQTQTEQYKPKQPVTKQKLSRQLSLQGSEDPRLKQSHAALRPQFSYDPRHMGQRYTSDSNHGMLLSDFIQSQSPDRANHPLAHSVSDLSPSGHQSGKEYHGNPALTRLPSAPDPYMVRQHLPPGVSLLMRQNSTSDPQLHILDQDEPRQYMLPMAARGTLPMKDTTGSVTFQIGSTQVPKSNMQLSHGHLSPSFNQSVPPQSFSNQYGSMPVNVAGMQYVRAQAVNQPHPYGQNFSQAYGMSVASQRPAMDIAGQSMSSTSPPYLTSRVPANPVPVSMPTSVGGSIGGFLASHPGPLPEDAPILAGDPRYKLYYHLCGLFPEHKVRAVMNLHPESTDPNEICAHIIGMNKG